VFLLLFVLQIIVLSFLIFKTTLIPANYACAVLLFVVVPLFVFEGLSLTQLAPNQFLEGFDNNSTVFVTGSITMANWTFLFVPLFIALVSITLCCIYWDIQNTV